MHKAACQDMGMNCSFTAEHETKEGALEALKKHGMENHAAEISAMMNQGVTEEQMTEKMASVVKES